MNKFINNGTNFKTPISLHNEIGQLMSIEPIFKNLEIVGPANEPTFTYKLTMGELSVVSKGNSKQSAKQEAAYQYVENMKKSGSIENVKIKQLVESVNQRQVSTNHIQDTNEEETYQSNVQIEFIQRYSMKHTFLYNTSGKINKHKKTIVCKTSVGAIKEKGYGLTKKIAAKDSALKLLFKLNLETDVKKKLYKSLCI